MDRPPSHEMLAFIAAALYSYPQGGKENNNMKTHNAMNTFTVTGHLEILQTSLCTGVGTIRRW